MAWNQAAGECRLPDTTGEVKERVVPSAPEMVEEIAEGEELGEEDGGERGGGVD